MEYFLGRIARLLKEEYGDSLDRHCLVFPGRRAGLYLLKHLAANLDKPAWSPPLYTINELFRSASDLQLPGPETLLTALYKIYRKLKKTAESFDEFYFWGDMILSDFDDADKYLADASLLFRNVSDLKNIDQEFGSLTEEHKEIIRRFWLNFDPVKPSTQKEGFINIWSVLAELYTEFRAELRSQNLAYEGMIFRDIAEDNTACMNIASKWDLVHFIGFNALNECEKTMMLKLKKAGKARFYWDYDNSYVEKDTYNSAGLFLRNDLKEFGNDMPADWSYNTMLSKKVNRRVIEASSDIAQVKLVRDLISGLPDITPENAHETAIVLADENLLVPMLTSLPNVPDLNITMGYPLRQTIIYSLLKNILDLQSTAALKDNVTWFIAPLVKSIISNNLIADLIPELESGAAETALKVTDRLSADHFSECKFLSAIFRKVKDPGEFSVYLKDILSAIASVTALEETDPEQTSGRNILNEMIFRIVLSLNRLDAVIRDKDILLTNDTFTHLLERMLVTQSVPFSGEPLTGIQIMGILETRALDFRNLIILSVNEGVMPAISSPASFIPFNLRRAFGLPSVNHQESIFAYHFYRLLHRSENVIFTYNSNSEGLRSGEMSRFLIQMKYSDFLQPEFLNLDFIVRPQSTVTQSLIKNEDHLARLKSLYSGNKRPLSPSAINTWIACRMKFYYRYVNGIKEPEKPEGEIDPASFGTILHEIMRNIYKEFSGFTVSSEKIERLIKDENALKALVNSNIKGFLGNTDHGFVRGDELIIRDVMLNYVTRILKIDKLTTPFSVHNLEEQFSFSLVLDDDLTIAIGGIVDRVDSVAGTYRIVDYKTGNVADSACSIPELFKDDRKKEYDGWLQSMLYCEAYLQGKDNTRVRPSIYGIKKMNGRKYDDRFRIKYGKSDVFLDDYNSIREEFIENLKNALQRIFSIDEPFAMTTDMRGKCNYCSYKGLCLR